MNGSKLAMPVKLAGVATTHGCHDCKHAHITPQVSECRAHAPQAFLIGGPDGTMRSIAVWPPIKPGDFCIGDWKLKFLHPDGSGPR